MTPTVLIHWEADGSFHFAAAPGVQVVAVDDRMPGDRVYVTDARAGALTPEMLRDVIGDSEIGFSGDASRAHQVARVIRGEDQ